MDDAIGPKRDTAGLPAVIATTPIRASALRQRPSAEFLSQLIAERDRLAPQRLRRRASADMAASAYREGVTRAIRRLPSGALRTLSV